MRLEITGAHRNNVRFESVRNLKIEFPDFIKSNKFGAGNTYAVPDHTGLKGNTIQLGRIDIDGFELKGDKGQIVENESFNVEDDVRMTGDFILAADKAFDVNAGDNLNIRLVITLGGNETDRDGNVMVELKEVEGCFDPVIKPEVDPVKIADELPDFLTDDNVKVDVSDVTLKFNVDMSEIPATLDINGVLMSRDKHENPLGIDVYLPKNGTVAELTKKKNNILYFYEGKPFDVNADGEEELATSGKRYEVENLTSLITELPDHVQIDLGGDNIAHSQGRVRMKQNELFTIQLGTTYNAHLDYNILMPFRFGGDLNIVYNDTIEDMNEDLQDYEATALAVTARVANTIPLQLEAGLTPADINGNKIDDIRVELTKATVAAASEFTSDESQYTEKESELEFNITLSDPKALKKLDKFFFSIGANAKGATGSLKSNQYIVVKDMRLKLKGQIIGDFN